jgi:hypothetical protein
VERYEQRRPGNAPRVATSNAPPSSSSGGGGCGTGLEPGVTEGWPGLKRSEGPGGEGTHPRPSFREQVAMPREGGEHLQATFARRGRALTRYFFFVAFLRGALTCSA